MIDDRGRRVKEATPLTPVEILGLNSVPDVERFSYQPKAKRKQEILRKHLLTRARRN